MIKLEKREGKMLLDKIAVGSPSAWTELHVPGGELVLILDNAQKELRDFEGSAMNKENPHRFDDPAKDFLDPEKYELALIPEGPALCVYSYTYGWKRLAELSGKYYVYRNLDTQEGEAGLVFVKAWCDKSRYFGNDKLAKFSGDSKISPVYGGLIIGSPAAWFFVNELGLEVSLNSRIEIAEFTYTSQRYDKAKELCANGYEYTNSIKGPNIGLYTINKEGMVQLLRHIEGDYSVLKKEAADAGKPSIAFLRDLSKEKSVQYTGSSRLTENLSAAGYALSLD